MCRDPVVSRMKSRLAACLCLFFALSSCDGGSDPTAPPEVGNVSVSPDTVALFVGEVAQLEVSVFDRSGSSLIDRVVSWSSSEPGVVTVTSEGLVTGIVPGGPVTVTATSEGITGTAAVTVTPPPATGFPVYVAVRTRGLGLEEPEFTLVLDESRSAKIASGDGRFVFQGVDLGSVILELRDLPDGCMAYPGESIVAEVIEFPEKGQIPGAEVLFQVTCFADTHAPPYGFAGSGNYWGGEPWPASQNEVSTGRLVRRLDLQGQPRAVNSDGTRLYLSDGDVLVIADPTAPTGSQTLATVASPVPDEGFRVAGLTPEGTELWAFAEGSGGSASIHTLDANLGTWQRALQLTAPEDFYVGASDLVFSRNGRRAYVSVRYFGGNISSPPRPKPVVLVIDTGSLQVVGSIEGFADSPRGGPVEIGVGPDGRLYAMDWNGNVKVVSTLTDEVERSFTMSSPETLQISHARSEAYFLADSEPYRVEIRELQDLETVVAVIPFPNPVQNLNLSPDGRLGYVWQDSFYSVLVDLEAQQILGRVWRFGGGLMPGVPSRAAH